MDAVWQELIRAVPWGAVIIILRWLDIKEKQTERIERDANAKDKAEQDRQSQIAISQTYASAINNLNKVHEISTANIVDAIKEMRMSISEQYRKMGITQGSTIEG
jgi:ribosome-binding ATPase YchF (GTP1/OBG family)